MTQSNQPNEDRRIDHLYDKVDDLKKEMNQRFDKLSIELNTKLDIILRHII